MLRNNIDFEGGWKEKIYDYCDNLFTTCYICGEKIDLKDISRFGAWYQPFMENTRVAFLCSNCFDKLKKAVEELKKKKGK